MSRSLAVMRRVKASLDPQVFNPGKVLYARESAAPLS
jgi:FAD/FMN-containing dehydrogenase